MATFNDELGNDLDSIKVDCRLTDDLESCKSFFTRDHNFKLCALNIRSIGCNFDKLLVALKRLDIIYDVIVLTECWLNSCPHIPQLPGYTSYKSDNNFNQNSGVAVYVRDIWDSSVTEHFVYKAQCLAIHISDAVNILAVYRSPSCSNTEQFLSSLAPYMTSMGGLPLVFAGDININILETSNTQNLEYLCLVEECGLVATITEPTRERSCLDHIYLSRSCLSHAPIGIVCRSVVTDHFPVMIGMKLKGTPRPQHSRTMIKRDHDAIKIDLLDLDWSFVLNTDNVNVATKCFVDSLMGIILKHTREVRLSRTKHNLKPWITPGLMRCMRHRDKLHHRARQEPNNKILKISYKRYQNFLVGLLRKLRVDYESKDLDINRNNPKKLWQSVKNLCGLSQANKVPTELLVPKDTTEQRKPIDLCNDHFCTAGQRLASRILTETNETEYSLARKVCITNTPSESFFLSPTSYEEVEKLVMKLENGKSPGIDGLTNTLIKHVKAEIIIPLTHIYNLSLSSGIFPDVWKVASVSPVHKSGPKDNIENYRPISLLSAFSKILEKIVNKRLTDFLESRNLTSSRQFGFRKGRSTEDAVSLLTSVVASKLDNKQRCVAVFLDLARAFDTVSVPILLEKLNRLGFRGIASDWFKSYLQERRQCVRIGSVFSSTQSINFGLPQGSILGPTLFNIYINDIHSMPIENAEVICYADDTAIVFHGPSWENALDYAERGMSRIYSWLQRNLLTLNAKKTVFLCFHITAASAPPSALTLKLHKSSCSGYDNTLCGCESLYRSNVIKYLGVFLDENLNFKTHAIALSSRVRKVIGIMKNLRDVASSDILISVYHTLCQSLLTYCNSCWGSAAKTNVILVERAQRSVLKVMMRRPLRYPTIWVYKDSGVLNVRQLFIKKLALSVHKSIAASEDKHVDNTLARRRPKLVPYPYTNTCFARRFGDYLRAHVYNTVDKMYDLRGKSMYEVRRILRIGLGSMSYEETENLLEITS